MRFLTFTISKCEGTSYETSRLYPSLLIALALSTAHPASHALRRASRFASLGVVSAATTHTHSNADSFFFLNEEGANCFMATLTVEGTLATLEHSPPDESLPSSLGSLDGPGGL